MHAIPVTAHMLVRVDRKRHSTRRTLVWVGLLGLGLSAAAGVLSDARYTAETSLHLVPLLRAVEVAAAIVGASLIVCGLLNLRGASAAWICALCALLDAFCASVTSLEARLWLIGRVPEWFEKLLLALPSAGSSILGIAADRVLIAAAAGVISWSLVSYLTSRSACSHR